MTSINDQTDRGQVKKKDAEIFLSRILTSYIIMEFTDPVSKYMSKVLITVQADDRMMAVKEVFDNYRIHHIPVVQDGYLVGMVSKSDYLLFLRGKNKNEYEKLIQISQLNNTIVEDVMTRGIATLEPTDRINVALEIFSENLFHSIPVVDNGKLVGILTTLDIIKAMVEEDRLRIHARTPATFN